MKESPLGFCGMNGWIGGSSTGYCGVAGVSCRKIKNAVFSDSPQMQGKITCAVADL